ncbi:hypothetical protein [Natronoarchaeum rubrum]|uniref:hypothetical protein n=1 Tax=Natronoarchaeum rubrum TaxID=755311 RepID=UPI0021130C51|nr:hypothetical protein [Natronoarchaeum rubrum]
MYLPSLDGEPRRVYHFEVGDPVGTVGLWKRYASDEFDEFVAEYPIYQNTRGQGVWNSEDVDTRNTDETDPSAAFWRALKTITTAEPGEPIDVRECEWYERELINSLLSMRELEHAGEELPHEIGELLAYAELRGESDE